VSTEVDSATEFQVSPLSCNYMAARVLMQRDMGWEGENLLF
jgi:hypothetical protein